MIRKLLAFVRGGSEVSRPTVVNSLWLGSSSAANGVLGAASSALLARYLGLSDFGTLTLMISVLNVLSDLGDLGLSATFVRFGAESVSRGDLDRFDRILGIMVRAKLVLSALIVVIALLLIDPIIASVFGHVDPGIRVYFLVAVFAAVLNIAATLFPPVFQSFKQYRLQAILSTLRAASKLMFILGGGMMLARWTVTAALSVEVLSAGVFLLIAATLFPRKAFRRGPMDRTLTSGLLAFNKWISLYQIITLFGSRMDVFSLGSLASTQELGLYGAASRIAGLVIAVTNSFYAVLLTEASSSGTQVELHRRIRNASAVVGMILLGLLCLFLLAPYVVPLLFGTSFSDGGRVLQVMIPGMAFVALAYPPNAALFAWNKSFVLPLTAAAATTIFVLGNVLLIPRYGSVGAAVAYSAYNCVSFLIPLAFYAYFARTGRRDGTTDAGA
jgi:O-antigen/teichoic acid export membrane protein